MSWYLCHLPRSEVVVADFVVLSAVLKSDHVFLSAVFMYAYSVGCISYHSCVSQCYCRCFMVTTAKRPWQLLLIRSIFLTFLSIYFFLRNSSTVGFKYMVTGLRKDRFFISQGTV